MVAAASAFGTLALTLLLAAPASFEKEAASALDDYRVACRAEGGRLWGVTLCGPMVVVEPESRRAVANTAAGVGALRPRGRVYLGDLPDEIGLANTAFDWAGRRWSMVLWPLPAEPTARRALLLHEAWHRQQPTLGFDAPMVDNAHLAEPEGRLWLRLEWRALGEALESRDEERRAAVADALLFRGRRYARFPTARREETALELNEGLAQYTGVRAGYGVAAAAVAAAALERADADDAFARSFAYATGPAWGLLLDDLRPGWRGEVETGVNFADLGSAVVAEVPPGEEAAGEARRRSEVYGFAEVSAQEEARAAGKRAERERLLADLVKAPGLVLPLARMQLQFDPGGVVPLPPHGSVYRKISIQDLWGEVEVSGEALLAADFASLALPGPASVEHGVVTGEGWVLRLAEGWRVEPRDDGRWQLLPPVSQSVEE